jgi:hypothetical protein
MTEDEEFDELPDEETLEKTVENLEERGFEVSVAENGKEALDEIRDLLPEGAEVFWGSSTTLTEIGFEEYVGEADLRNVKEEIWSIDDDEEREKARREAVTSEFFFGSVNAISEDGEMVAADMSGSRVGAYPYAAENLVLVSGTNKIVENLEKARERLFEHAYPQENERAQEEYGIESRVAKEFTYRYEMTEGRTKVILIEERLGF